MAEREPREVVERGDVPGPFTPAVGQAAPRPLADSSTCARPSRAAARAAAPQALARERLHRIPDRPVRRRAHGPSSAPRGCAPARGSGGSGLLARERRHVARGTRRAAPGPTRSARAVGRRVDQAGAGQRLHARSSAASTSSGSTTSSQSRSAVRRARLELEAGHDRLASQPVANEARQPQVGGARDDPLLARGQVKPAAARGDHVVDHVEQLAGAADRVGLGRGDPQLLGVSSGSSGGARAAQPAEDLVDVAEVARDEEQERDLPVVEPGQVEARPRTRARRGSADGRPGRRAARPPRSRGRAGSGRPRTRTPRASCRPRR